MIRGGEGNTEMPRRRIRLLREPRSGLVRNAQFGEAGAHPRLALRFDVSSTT